MRALYLASERREVIALPVREEETTA